MGYITNYTFGLIPEEAEEKLEEVLEVIPNFRKEVLDK